MEIQETMQTLASTLDTLLNGPAKGADRKVGFALLTYNMGEDLSGTGRINYVGNGEREDVLTALKELVARWEGRYSTEGGNA